MTDHAAATPAPALVIERFLEASAILSASASMQERASYRRVLEGVGDIEAIEVAARYRRKLRLLSDHLRLMVYLAETEPRNQRFFVKRRANRAAAFAAIAVGAFRTAYKLAKGTFLLTRVRDV
jgi:hypothetical protein